MCSLRGKDRPEMSMAFEMPLTTSADPSLLPSNLDISLVLVDVRVSTLVVVMSFATKVLHVQSGHIAGTCRRTCEYFGGVVNSCVA